ncbi:hypothetical protein WMY93_032947 [Mugilogobius chulae]|uniref:Uncharacterized protein n=1 Tax=Mugilogobius chulae TaxID=88201 RepID=A0AAW0MQ15_9GOBI
MSLTIFRLFLCRVQVLIPISLFVSIEIVKICQVYFIHNDLDLYDEETDSHLQCRALNITEDLGQMQYIFSDKTGTLTRTRWCSAAAPWPESSTRTTPTTKLRLTKHGSGGSLTHELLRGFLPTYVKALDAIAKHNGILRREIFAGDSARAKCAALKAALDAAVQENQALLSNAEESGLEGALASQRGDAEAEKRLVREEIKAIHQKLLEQISSVVIEDSEKEKQRQRRVEMEAENCRLLEENNTITDACEELQNKLSPLQTEETNRTLRQRNENLHQELQQLSSQVSQMDSERCPAEIEAENQRLLEENEDLEEMCNELQNKLSLSEEERAKREENQTLRQQNVHLHKKLQQLASELPEEDSEQRICELKEENDRILEENAEVEDACKELETKLSHFQAVKEECAKWEEKNEPLRKQNVHMHEKLQELASELPEDNLEQRVGDLEEENSRILEENEDLKNACKELETKLSRFQEVKEECAEWEEKNEILRQHNLHLHEKLQELASKLPEDDLEQRVCELKDENSRILQKNQEIEETCNEIQTELISLESVMKECETLEATNKTLHEQYAHVTEQLRQLYSQLPEEDLEQRRAELNAEKHRMCVQNQAITNGCELLQRKLKHLETVKDDCGKLETEIQTLLVEKTHSGKELDRLLTKIDENKMEERHAQLEEERDREMEQRDALRHKIYKTLMKLAKESCWEKKSETLEVSKRALVKENEQLEKLLDKLTRTHDQMKLNRSHAQRRMKRCSR